MPSAGISGNFPQRSLDEGDFHVQTFSLKIHGAAEWEGSAAPLHHLRNTHAVRATDKSPEDGVLIQEHGDTAKT